ncbi:MAG: Holliday junction branch migration DNA helicase RuvB [Chloroflexota bacterium]
MVTESSSEAFEDAEEQQTITNLRPQSLEEYGLAGQRAVVENLAIALKAARKRGEPLDHVLLHGPPGLGKTTLAHIVAHEMEGTLVGTSGPALERQSDLMGILSNLETGSVLFVDEIHRLPRAVEEFLYSAMEDFKVDFIIDKGAHARTIKFPLRRFTLVGATTRTGMLSAPLLDRFGLVYHLDFYAPEDLAKVVTRSASLLGTRIDESGAREIAARSRGTPRIANRLLKRVRDFAEVRGDGAITVATAAEALDREGVDQNGLNDLDRRYLHTIVEYYGGGPVGIEALAATINEEKDTLVDVIEPYLLKENWVVRTAGGRKVGGAYYNLMPRQDTLFS